MVEVVLEGPAKNALGTKLLTQVRDAVRAAGGKPLLVSGAGDAFSAGLDLKEIGSLDPAAMERFLALLVETIDGLFRYPGPVVAAVNGHAIAGGAILAAACDHRVGPTDPKARFALNEVALGLRFPPRLQELVRYRVVHAETVMLGAGMMGAAEALRLGLLDELADDPLAVARQRLAERAAHPPAIYAAAKDDLRRTVRADADAEARFVREILPVWAGDELRQKIHAFLARKG